MTMWLQLSITMVLAVAALSLIVSPASAVVRTVTPPARSELDVG